MDEMEVNWLCASLVLSSVVLDLVGSNSLWMVEYGAVGLGPSWSS